MSELYYLSMSNTETKLQELYARYDKRCSRGQFGLAEATLDQIRALENKKPEPTTEEMDGLIPLRF